MTGGFDWRRGALDLAACPALLRFWRKILIRRAAIKETATAQRPVLSLAEVCNRSGLSFPAASSAMQFLAGQGIVRELTGRPRNRLFCYDRYLSILAEGTEAI